MKNILTEAKDHILFITINRPEKLNALNLTTLIELSEALNFATENESIKGIIITGGGKKAFVAGADIEEIAEIKGINSRKFSENGQEIFDKIERCNKPVIAAVNGYALGGGCELALCCHIRIASTNAKFGLPEVNLGIIPAYGGTQRLSHIVGKGIAFEIMMTGEMIPAEEAYRIGIVNKVVEIDELLNSAEAMMKKIINKAPVALAQIIECVNAAFDEDEDGYQTEANSFGICSRTEDFKEGTKAFIEKRPPHFSGH